VLAGVPMMIGADVSRRLRAGRGRHQSSSGSSTAGGEIAGKAVCEYSMRVRRPATPSSTGPVQNPRKAGYTTGGSSSGSGALVAAGDVDMAIGGDQAGSIRIPASFCGIRRAEADLRPRPLHGHRAAGDDH